jgi:hypothetical protein
MALDLKKLRAGSLINQETNPREIFNLLPEKNPKYQYLRDVQAEVLSHWHERRKEKDLVVKMNTGGGKTVVGLLLLKSCLNEGITPAIYVVPDGYLATQVEIEAKQLGIAVEREPDAPAVLQGKAIGLITVHKLFNGLSKFGVGDRGIQIPIGSIVIDDAHACMSTIESQFTITLNNQHSVFTKLLNLFRDDLKRQNEALLLEVESGDPNAVMLVPFWVWNQQQNEVIKILQANSTDDVIKYHWALIKNFLLHSRCVFSGARLEISPRCLPIEALPSFVSAQRRVFMTATLADDSILISDLNANPETVANQITPKTANDIGERMILSPQVIAPNLDDEEIKRYLQRKAKEQNVVVIVPSNFRADFWRPIATIIADASNLEDTVAKLKNSHVGLVVFINKYDGVDLPGNACRILVLDGLPKARKLIERVENNLLGRSKNIIGKQIQRIEQGIGRGVRGNDDYCVVMLMGSELIQVLYSLEAKEMFSPATRAQLNLSDELADQIENGLDELDGTINYCLSQDSEWKSLARERLVGIRYTETHVRSIAIAQREAFESAVIRDFKRSVQALQQEVNTYAEDDPSTLGWLNWQLAEYTDFINPVDAQLILKKAIASNRRVVKPIDGIDYERLDARGLEQSRSVVWRLRSYKNNSSKFQIDVNGILDSLKFEPETAKQFENAMCEVAELLGFGSQRPENDYGKGPDVLWATGNLNYFVIECKNGAVSERVNKSDCNQLTGSVMWFQTKYDQTSTCIPVLIHPSNIFERAATPAPNTRVMTPEKLDQFKQSVRDFSIAVASKMNTIEHDDVYKILDHHNLTPMKILDCYTVAAKGQN